MYSKLQAFLSIFFLILLQSNGLISQEKKISKSACLRYKVVSVDTDIRELELMNGSFLDFWVDEEGFTVGFRIINSDLEIWTWMPHEVSSDLNSWMCYKRNGEIDCVSLNKSVSMALLDNKQSFANYKLIEGVSKQILGYSCLKYVSQNGGKESTVWMTKRVQVAQPFYRLEKGTRGNFPLEFSFIGQYANMVLRAVEIIDKKGELIKSLYEQGNHLTQTEWENKYGQIYYGLW